MYQFLFHCIELFCGLATKRDTQSFVAQEQTICNNVVVVIFLAFSIRGLTSFVSTAKILHHEIIYDNGYSRNRTLGKIGERVMKMDWG